MSVSLDPHHTDSHCIAMSESACKSECSSMETEAASTRGTRKRGSRKDDNSFGNNAPSRSECDLKRSRKVSFKKRKRQSICKSFTCNTCGKVFNDKYNLTIHYRIHTGERNYACSVCGKKFTYKNYLTVHYRIHSGDRSYVCGVCGKGFITKSNLTAHIKTHDVKEGTQFPCNVCGVVFKRKCNLTSHKKIHTGNSAIVKSEKGIDGNNTGPHYMCKVCGKLFLKRVRFRNHIRIHEEKRYVCEYCGRKFQDNSKLGVHLTIHTGDRKFGCDDCGQRFSQKSHLRVHARTHTGEKKHICGVCGKGFNIKTNLNNHILMHNGERNHVCELCGWAFTQKSALNWHQKTVSCWKPNRKRRKKLGVGHSMCKPEFLECDICQGKFSDKASLIHHFADHENHSIFSLDTLSANIMNTNKLRKILKELKPRFAIASRIGAVVKIENSSQDAQNCSIGTFSNLQSPGTESDMTIKTEIDDNDTTF